MGAKRSTRIQEILIKSGVVDELQVRAALARQASWGGRLPKILVDLGFASEENVTAALAAGLKMPVTHLGNIPRDAVALAKLGGKFCEERGVFPVAMHNRTLRLAMADPTELDLIDEVQARANARVEPLLSGEEEIVAAISWHYWKKAYQPIERGLRRFADPPPPSDANEERMELVSAVSPDLRTRPASANTLLDEMFPVSGEAEFSREELSRLDAARRNQEKTSTILRAVAELLAARGYRLRS